MEVLDCLFDCWKNLRAFLSMNRFLTMYGRVTKLNMELVRGLMCLSNTVVHIYYFGSTQCGHLVFKHVAIVVPPNDQAGWS